jgi:hypothetical protein
VEHRLSGCRLLAISTQAGATESAVGAHLSTAGASLGRGWLAPEDAGRVAVQLGEEVLDALRGGQKVVGVKLKLRSRQNSVHDLVAVV